MPVCSHCQKEIDIAAAVCPFCHTPVLTTDPVRRRVVRLVSIISSLLILVGFFLPWFHPLSWPLNVGADQAAQQALNASISLSGLDLTRTPFFAHEFYSPQTLPEEVLLLWLLPLTALLLLGAELARVGRSGAFRWLRFWAALAICVSALSLLRLFFNPSTSLNLLNVLKQFSFNGEYGFWLTCAGLCIATPLLFRPQKEHDESKGLSSERRTVLVASLNLLALLGVGTAATIFLLSEQQKAARVWGTRALFGMNGTTNFPLGKVLAWSPDGKTLLARTLNSGLLGALPPSSLKIIWEYEDSIRFATLPFQEITAQAWSPDGRYLAMTVLGQPRILTWSIESADQWVAFRNYTAGGTGKALLRGLAWSPDGQRLAGGVQGIDPQGNALYVWETASGKQLAAYASPLQMNAAIYDVAWSPDGHTLAACGVAGHEVVTGQSPVVATTASGLQGFVVAWDVQSGQVSFQRLSSLLGAVITSLAWSPDSRLLAFADGAFQENVALQSNPFTQLVAGVSLQTWEVAANRLERSYSGHILGINCVAWSPDGQRLAAGGDDETVQVWETTNGQRLLVYQGDEDEFSRVRGARIMDLAWSPDGKTLASLTNFEVRVWNAP